VADSDLDGQAPAEPGESPIGRDELPQPAVKKDGIL